jgi:peroxiredoxin
VDEQDQQLLFAAKLGLKFPLVSDTSRQICLLFGTVDNASQLSARQSFLIDKSGVVRWIDTNIQVQSHGQDVLSKIQELGLER